MKTAYTVCVLGAGGEHQIISEGLDGVEYYDSAETAETVMGAMGAPPEAYVHETRVEDARPLLNDRGEAVA